MRWLQMRCVFVCVARQSLSDFLLLLQCLTGLLKQLTPFGGSCKITPSWCQYLITRSRPGLTAWFTRSVRVGQQLWCVSVWNASSFGKDLRPFPFLSKALAILKSRTRFPFAVVSRMFSPSPRIIAWRMAIIILIIIIVFYRTVQTPRSFCGTM